MLPSNLTARTLNVEAESYFEMSETAHQSKWRLVPDCVILHQYCRENLRPRISKIYFHIIGPGSSVGIATDYGLDGPGSNPGGTRFSARPDRPWGPPSLL